MEKEISYPPTPVLQVVGVGGAGCNTVGQLKREDFQGVRFAIFNTDAATLGRWNVETKILLGSKSTRGLGAGSDPQRGRAAALEDSDRIRAICADAEVVFVIAGLGGGTGTGAAPVVARLAREAGALVLGIAILPFDCEGNRRQLQAQAGFQELKQAADVVICLPNQKVFRLIDDTTSLLEAFAFTNEFVAQGVQAIYRLLTRPGLIQVNFADLCSVTRDNHSETSLTTAEATGGNRAREVVEKLLRHPLLDSDRPLAEATSVLVSIAGGPDLAMAEVNGIMEPINRNCDHAHIILGAAIDEQLAGKICVTMLVSSPAAAMPEPGIAESGIREQSAASLSATRPAQRPVVMKAPPPESTLDSLAPAGAASHRTRRPTSRMRQGQLPLEIVSKGRFEKSEPTIFQGQDLDVPTYIRRGIALN